MWQFTRDLYLKCAYYLDTVLAILGTTAFCSLLNAPAIYVVLQKFTTKTNNEKYHNETK